MLYKGLSLAVLFTTFLQTSYSQADPKSAYQMAVAQVNAANWSAAQNTLKNINSSRCDPPIYYLLGMTSANLSDYKGAVDFENKALACSPPLAKNFRQGALELRDFAVVHLGATLFFRGQVTMATRDGRSVSSNTTEQSKYANDQLYFEKIMPVVKKYDPDIESKISDEINEMLRSLTGGTSTSPIDERVPSADIPK